MAPRRKLNLRGLLAGTGASGSLLAAAVVAFLAVTAFVALDGLPFGAGIGDDEAIALEGAGSATLTAGPGGAGPSGVVDLGPAASPDGAGAAGPAAAGGPDGTPDPGEPPPPPDGTAPPVPAAPPAAATGAPNPVGQAVAGVDATIEETTGVNPDLGGATRPLTGAVDQAVQGLTGDGVGGHLDNSAAGGVLDRAAPTPERLLEPPEADLLELGVVLDGPVVAAGNHDRLPGFARSLQELLRPGVGNLLVPFGVHQ